MDTYELNYIKTAVCVLSPAGLVILDSPIHPVMEGDDVPLSCRSILSQTSTSAFQTEFFKDGVFVGDSNTGNMTLYRVSKSDEGLYKCRIFGSKNESQESWLTVRGEGFIFQKKKSILIINCGRALWDYNNVSTIHIFNSKMIWKKLWDKFVEIPTPILHKLKLWCGISELFIKISP